MVARARPSPPGAPLLPPPALAAGDTVALFAPSAHSGRNGAARVAGARAILEGWKLRPLPAPAEETRHLYLAGTDAERAQAFQRLYCDPAVRGLFAERGGYGAARMLPHLDAARIAAAAPKPVVGMSDVCALFGYLHAVTGVGVVHGPCLAAPGMQESALAKENLADLHSLLFEPQRALSYPCELLHPGAQGGAAAGRLTGGNVSVIAAAMGTPWALETAGCVLLLEDVNEAPYRIDRYLTQLRQAGRLEGLAGLVFGQLDECDSDPPGLLRDVLADLFRDAPYPVAMGLEAGHGARNRALPLGREARLTFARPEPGAPAELSIAALA